MPYIFSSQLAGFQLIPKKEEAVNSTACIYEYVYTNTVTPTIIIWFWGLLFYM